MHKQYSRLVQVKASKGLGSDQLESDNCWKYALEAIINWLLLYFLVHDNRLLSMLELY